MHQIQLNDQLYQEAELRAAEAGFGSVDEYVADVLRHDLQEETENFDNLFTPERLAHIDRAAAEIDAGQGLTSEQVDAELAQRRDEWLRQNPR
jgi:hypothetical protein